GRLGEEPHLLRCAGHPPILPSRPDGAREARTYAATASGDHLRSAPMRIDLHTHSTVSDGTCTPTEGIEAAAAARLDVVALTDHDGLGGWTEAQQAAERLSVGFVPGVELSCRWYGVEPSVPLHLLAYYVDPADRALDAEMARVRASREHRA